MHKDLITMILAVPMAVIGGLATLWLSLELQAQTSAGLLTVSFLAFSIFFFIAAITFGVLSAVEVYSQD